MPTYDTRTEEGRIMIAMADELEQKRAGLMKAAADLEKAQGEYLKVVEENSRLRKGIRQALEDLHEGYEITAKQALAALSESETKDG